MKSVFKIIFFVFSFFIKSFFAYAETPLDDIEIKLAIETQDLIYDFEDDEESVEKERVVIYSLKVLNHGPKTLENLVLFMTTPDYLEYQPGTTILKNNEEENWINIEDEQAYSSLMLGYNIPFIGAGSSLTFQSKYQVVVPDNVLDDPLYTLGFASLVGPYSDLPVMSNIVHTVITGHPLGSLNVKITPDPPEGKTVFSGSKITYLYTLSNAGGLVIKDITLVNYLPEGAICLENCGILKVKDELQPGDEIFIPMEVHVKIGQLYLKEIKHIGYDVSTATLKNTEVRQNIIHPLNSEIEIGTDDFTLLTEQVPNLILNSPNQKPRADEGDMTETQYVLKYTGRGKTNTFHPSSSFGIDDTGQEIYHGYCSDYYYDHGKNSKVYAYNSSGGGCEKIINCLLTSSPLDFLIETQSPESRPSLIFDNQSHLESKHFMYGDTASVNSFMQFGGIIKPPEKFTLSRAIEDGMMGEFQSMVKTQNLTEDLWVYAYAGYSKSYDTCSCGEDCTHTDKYPVYTWQKKSSTPLSLQAEDESHVSVYSSTAWLKTEGGHIGTNGSIINHETEANKVNLPFDDGEYINSNDYIHDPEKILTPSNLYTPFGQTNADYMIFSRNENQSFTSASGEAWEVYGTDFGFMEQGDAYDREAHPRNYEEDLLVREKFGQVVTDEFPEKLMGSVDIGDQMVWYQTGDLVIGQKNLEDSVYFSGGQSRIYVEGDVYINANIFYDSDISDSYEKIPLLRIDAKNIYVDTEVGDLEALFLARENFYSGEGHAQLRILGDVIAKFVHWERKPVLELSPEGINQPSEYLIEDLRKYVVPIPGDTQLPDEYDTWQQLNPGSGKFLNGY